MSSFPLGAGYRSGAEVQGFVEELKRERREINDTLRELIGRSGGYIECYLGVCVCPC